MLRRTMVCRPRLADPPRHRDRRHGYPSLGRPMSATDQPANSSRSPGRCAQPAGPVLCRNPAPRPGIENPIHEAINQLLRYSNQRRELFPTRYSDNEGVEKLFHTNQLLIASNFFEARAATIGAPPEAYLEWADTSPVPMSTVAEELGIISADEDIEEASSLSD